MTPPASDTAKTTAFRGRGLRAGYGEIEILHHLDFALPAGCISVLVGPGGSGKTTFLRVLHGQPDPALLFWQAGELVGERGGLLLPQPAAPPGGPRQTGSARPKNDPATRREEVFATLASTTSLLLLDEPADILEAAWREEIGLALRAQTGRTVVLATHHLGFMRQVADFVVLMVDGELVEAAPAQSFFTQPRQERTRSFLRWGS